MLLQQYLPFTVLKLSRNHVRFIFSYLFVATVLTVYGIETLRYGLYSLILELVATVLTVYGIETRPLLRLQQQESLVATVLTVYGIETLKIRHLLIDVTLSCNSTYRLRY